MGDAEGEERVEILFSYCFIVDCESCDEAEGGASDELLFLFCPLEDFFGGEW
ncbi:MAG: hypothetical protein H6P94_340 [Thermoplasmatales archaeon]|nr:hypothetical protein [Thermoplasmatales archaeon]